MHRVIGAAIAATLMMAPGVATVAQAATEASFKITLKPTGSVVDGDAYLSFTYTCTVPEGTDAAGFDLLAGNLAQPYIRDRQGLAVNQTVGYFYDDDGGLLTCDGTPQTLLVRLLRFGDRVFHPGRAYAYNLWGTICYADWDTGTGDCSDDLLPPSMFVQLRGT